MLIGGSLTIPGAIGGVEATVDNELKFFSVFGLAYGAFCLWVARNIQVQYRFIPIIALVFFIGGLAEDVLAKAPRLLLHAQEFWLDHPITGIEVRVQVTPDF
ncbi:DUF4345 family protein [Paraglaciecola sp.]|uniref:DUF4345 family protein n=1 Tax=Paraglaciecola sp. TaxID=1920173 RepID=UPI0030F47726